MASVKFNDNANVEHEIPARSPSHSAGEESGKEGTLSRRDSIALTEEDRRFEDISEDLKKKCHAAFDKYDIDGAKCLDIGDIQRALEDLGVSMDLTTLMGWMEKADMEPHFALNFQDFMAIVQAQTRVKEALDRKSFCGHVNVAFDMLRDAEADACEESELGRTRRKSGILPKPVLEEIGLSAGQSSNDLSKETLENTIETFGLNMKVTSPKKRLNLSDFQGEFEMRKEE